MASDTEAERQAIAAWLERHRPKQCPPAAAAPTSADVPEIERPRKARKRHASFETKRKQDDARKAYLASHPIPAFQPYKPTKRFRSKPPRQE